MIFLFSLSVNRIPQFISSDLSTLFSNCYPNTLDTTVASYTAGNNTTKPNTFVITGDISAQWLRDSTNQVLPYFRFINEDQNLKEMICGLIQRQLSDIIIDPFANAFNHANEGGDHQSDQRKPVMQLHVFEGKYELDSLAAILKLTAAYYNTTKDTQCFLQDELYTTALQTILNTMHAMQQTTSTRDQEPYNFNRVTGVATDTLSNQGTGNPGLANGMIRSAFRPSDDATTLPFLIPANAMAVVELRNTANMINNAVEELQTIVADTHSKQLQTLSSLCLQLSDEIDAGIQSFALHTISTNKQIYAYEVDGYGGQIFMDDANVPSLLSLPYLGYTTVDDPVYQNTRKFVLSDRNPYYFVGKNTTELGGIGGKSTVHIL